MNKKGFSLIELLAVIVILAIIFAIVLIYYTEVVEKRRLKDYNNIVEIIEENTKVLVTTNFDVSNKVDSKLEKEFDEEVKECKIPYTFLIEKGLMDADTKDPRRNKVMDSNSFVKVTSNENDELEFQFFNMDTEEDDYDINSNISDSLDNCLN